MYYYKVLDNNGNVAYLLTYNQEPNITNPSYIEITIEEYDTISTEFVEKDQLTNQLYHGEITNEEVPEEWRNEIQMRVDEMIAERGEYTPEISESEIAVNEALAILHGEVAE